ncbi:MAG: hypothetical protein HWD60_11750 [Defluviicoccus sp.]|nr:MAG: hypothetical protein HWD60_11750 [Defluviicoccus sp.]
MSDPTQGEVGQSKPGEHEPSQGEHAQRGRAGQALRRLEDAVARLEAAADIHAKRLVEGGDLTSGIYAEAEALRSLQHLLSDRLDAAIARLKSDMDG